MTDLADIKSITNEYYEQVYAHKFENVEEIDQKFQKLQSIKL